jgi:peptidoglycan hydrolase CwlO-like protein
MQYVQMDQTAKQLGNLLEWLSRWIQSEEQKKSAFQSGAELKFQEVQKSLTENEKGLTDIQSKIDGLNTKIQSLQVQAADVTVQQTELIALEESKKTKQQDIESGKEQRAEQEFLLKSFESSANVNPQQRQFYFDNLLSPLLDALTTISAIGSKTTNDGSVFQSTIHLKLE